MVEILLEYEIKINQNDMEGNNVLFYAINNEGGCQKQIIEILLQEGLI